MHPIVAFQGERGAFSEMAAEAAIPGPFTPLPCATFDEVVQSVVSGTADLGVLPVENLIAGAIVGAIQAIGSVASIEQIREHTLPVRLALLGLPDSSASMITEALSHPVALRQCTRFLAEHPAIRAIEAHDTAGAARLVAERGDPRAAAIAPAPAAARYGLQLLAEGLEDRPDNATRFVIIRRRSR
jgi:prephenate dehydratase